jgi:hypothetical protein
MKNVLNAPALNILDYIIQETQVEEFGYAAQTLALKEKKQTPQ